jgi:hypothetical protein
MSAFCSISLYCSANLFTVFSKSLSTTSTFMSALRESCQKSYNSKNPIHMQWRHCITDSACTVKWHLLCNKFNHANIICMALDWEFKFVIAVML